ncbi:hypothetical protein BDN72DRAFT_894630 [Pluteus cervinus]|uniref:Uncharacterized protein n=1 Tax=Pluteus cervinus TaxID=181527 RepID=A0ACD3B4C8_9AGAR|nr:hypothetical protein BDN72DRAFT_894630 [Pluteus cervinus]
MLVLSSWEETFKQFTTNVFGALNVARAFLPYMRKRRTGTIVFPGSITGQSAISALGFILRRSVLFEGWILNGEVTPLGLRSICIEFGYSRTAFLSPDHWGPSPQHIEDNRGMAEKMDAFLREADGKQPGDPVKGVSVILDIVRGVG